MVWQNAQVHAEHLELPEPPAEPWRVWWLIGDRASGKTTAAFKYCAERAPLPIGVGGLASRNWRHMLNVAPRRMRELTYVYGGEPHRWRGISVSTIVWDEPRVEDADAISESLYRALVTGAKVIWIDGPGAAVPLSLGHLFRELDKRVQLAQHAADVAGAS